jgi:glucose/arabinose dehydrogenase
MPLKRSFKILLALVAFLALFVTSCVLLLPERFAVNVPLGSVLRRMASPPAPAVMARRLHTPPGFGFSRFADGLANVRFLRALPHGRLLASQPREGRVVLLEPDADGDGHSDGVRTVLSGLRRPHGLDLHDGFLYVAEGDGIGRARFDMEAGRVEGAYQRVVDGLPEGGNHWTRTVRFGPDGMMYVSVGSSCNVCIEKDPRRAAVLRFRADGSGGEIFASGLRNSVGLDFHPASGELYATDNGRDLLGDDYPPCELNRIVQGGFYGWPFANGDRRPDPDFGATSPERVATSIPPVHGFRAHNAPLGFTFIRGERVPPEYRGAALAALHGSWNRTHKDGYKVVSLHWQADGSIVERDFLWGFLEGEDVIGRPVDVTEGADGSFYVSDDYSGSIYRVAYGASSPASAEIVAQAASGHDSDLSRLPAAEVAAGAERGRALYEASRCASCHDPQRAAKGVVPRVLVGLDRRYTLARLQGYLATPNPPMPAYPFSEAERRDLAIYLLARERGR